MFLFTIPQYRYRINFMFGHSWVLILLFFIVILIFTVVGFILHWFIFRKIRAEIAVFTVSFRTVVIFMMLSIIVPSSTMRSEHESCWILIVCWCCNVYVDYVAEIAENIVQKVKMFTKLIKILLHDLELLI